MFCEATVAFKVHLKSMSSFAGKRRRFVANHKSVLWFFQEDRCRRRFRILSWFRVQKEAS
ncbi:hypothetical protein X975_11117, partial [Stegodyphus mimosarum]